MTFQAENQAIQAAEAALLSVAIHFGAGDLTKLDLVNNKNDLHKFVVIQKVPKFVDMSLILVSILGIVLILYQSLDRQVIFSRILWKTLHSVDPIIQIC